MKIYNRSKFLELPPGIFFCKGVEWCFDDICVKGDSWENDFIYMNLATIDADSSDELFDRLQSMKDKGASFPINDTFARDGCFDNDALFLVFEVQDLLSLMKHMGYAMNAMISVTH